MTRIRCSTVAMAVVFLSTGWMVPTRAEAQAAVSGVVFGGAGGFTGVSEGAFHVGGGVQAVGRAGLGVLTEIGYVSFVGDPGEGIGLFTANAIYLFGPARAERRARPFVTGGYALAFQSGSVNLWNAGAGVDWSLGRRSAVRTEVRTHFDVGTGELAQFWQVRAGFVWR